MTHLDSPTSATLAVCSAVSSTLPDLRSKWVTLALQGHSIAIVICTTRYMNNQSISTPCTTCHPQQDIRQSSRLSQEALEEDGSHLHNAMSWLGSEALFEPWSHACRIQHMRLVMQARLPNL